MSDQAWTPTCVLCAARGRQRQLEAGHCCAGCAQWLHDAITSISEYALEAAAWISPRPGSGHTGVPTYGSRPPINVSAVDPECELIELNVGDESSAVTILEMLEAWERSVREDRSMAPYGPASLSRARGYGTSATLVGCIDFLAGQVEWMTTDPGFGLEEMADHVRRAAAILRRWTDTGGQIGTRIACPSTTEEGICGKPIRISTEGEPVTCRGCGYTWTVDWLIRVAGDDADGWADMEAVCRLSGLHERTIRRWSKAGKVRKRGLLYNVRDVSQSVRAANPQDRTDIGTHMTEEVSA